MDRSNRAGDIRVGIGGWTYEPWRETFYPADVPAKDELHYASRQVTAIEINGTFYRTQQPSSFAKWHDETPDNFVFAVKAVRYATNRRVLAEAGDSVNTFMQSGLSRLGAKLGPVLWQFAPTKRYDPDDMAAFVALLPRELDGRPLRHVLDVRHESFKTPAFVELCRRAGVATVVTDSPDYPSFGDITADFVYLRLMRCESERATGYAPQVLDDYAACARTWAAGGEPAALPKIEPDRPPPSAAARDVYVFMINGAKERAPAAARELLQRLDGSTLGERP